MTAGDDCFGQAVMGFLLDDRCVDINSTPASLPVMVGGLESEWGVRTGSPFTRGTGAWTAPAVTAEGERAVLKVGWPHREAHTLARAGGL